MVTKDRNTFIVLGALTLIFLGRVVAQLIQYLYPIANLPPIDAWQSGALSYGWLLFSQIIILSIQITVLMKIHKGTYVFYKTKGQAIYVFGILYFSISILRLILGSFLYNDHEFFWATIPAVFHIFLSAFFLVLGFYESNNAKMERSE